MSLPPVSQTDPGSVNKGPPASAMSSYNGGFNGSGQNGRGMEAGEGTNQSTFNMNPTGVGQGYTPPNQQQGKTQAPSYDSNPNVNHFYNDLQSATSKGQRDQIATQMRDQSQQGAGVMNPGLMPGTNFGQAGANGQLSPEQMAQLMAMRQAAGIR